MTSSTNRAIAAAAATLLLSACAARPGGDAQTRADAPAPTEAPTSQTVTTGGEMVRVEPPPPVSDEDRELLDGFTPEATALGEELDQALALGEAVDCGAARDLRDRICDLSERVCRIASRHPEEPEAGERCDDGQIRCDRAKSGVLGRCGADGD